MLKRLRRSAARVSLSHLIADSGLGVLLLRDLGRRGDKFDSLWWGEATRHPNDGRTWSVTKGWEGFTSVVDRTGQVPVIDLLKARERAENIGSTIDISLGVRLRREKSGSAIDRDWEGFQVTYHQEGTYSRRETRVFPGSGGVLGVPEILGFGFAVGGDFGTKTAKMRSCVGFRDKRFIASRSSWLSMNRSKFTPCNRLEVRVLLSNWGLGSGST